MSGSADRLAGESVPFGAPLRRRAFLLEPGLRFLNHGSFGATPRPVLDAADAARRHLARQPVHVMDAELMDRLDLAADRVAALVKSPPERLALVDNATTGIHTVLRSVELGAGDEILTTGHVYPAVRNALHHAAREAGAVLCVARVPLPLRSPDQVLAAVDATLSARTRLVVVDHITSKTGLVFPVEEIVALCRARGVPVAIDGAHAPVHIPLNLAALDADYYTGNLHKWAFTVKGCAFLYAREPDRIVPPVVSHLYDQGMRPACHWIGTRDPSPWWTIPDALEFLDQLGGERAVRRHNDALCAQAAELLHDRLGMKPLSPPGMRAALCAMPHPHAKGGSEEEARTLHDALLVAGFELPVFSFAGRCLLRISAQVYNELAEYEQLAEQLAT